jgi:alpha-galactosidase
MKDARVAVIGAGSYVFGPSVLSQAIRENRLDNVHLALMDTDGTLVGLMASVGRRMAQDAGVRLSVTAHTDRCEAIDGADFVVCSAAQELRKRFLLDCEIIDKYLPGHWVTEFGGIAGISYSLRQIALIERIAADMMKMCPKARLLNTANPLPRVCQAAYECGIPTVGFCSVSIGVYSQLWAIFEGCGLPYPFEAGRQRWEATMAGVNHFSWLLGLRDKATGENRLPQLYERIRRGHTSGNRRCEAFIGSTGFMLLPNDHHVSDFLEPAGPPPPRHVPQHGSPEERQQRLATLRGIAEGRESADPLLAHPSWERPMDLVAAFVTGRSADFPSLNLANTGQIANLPRNVFVETPATVTGEAIRPTPVVLPGTVVALTRRAAEVTDAIVRAARNRSHSELHKAVEMDPTITDKSAGKQAIDECLKAHADILPHYEDA